jgi:exodeoxyribonuclease VII large subunit
MEKGNMKEIWTVSELNDKIKALLESYYGFMWIEGEVSNLRRPASGHRYFTLKDNKSQIRAVVFQSPAGRATGQGTVAGFDLEDGLYVLCRGRLTVYGPRGDYQLIIDRIEPRGLGALQKAYEQLKTRLMAEGLFDARHKRPLPFLPGKIGIVTSPSGAVIRDILQISGRRFPAVSLVVAPVRVQGLESAEEICRALADLNRLGDVDVIILARGGGTFEDLHPFNTEAVVRAIFDSTVPVVSAVGHETDVTLADFAADLRASTPSAAAELVVPDREDLRAAMKALARRLLRGAEEAVEERRQGVKALVRALRDPRRILEERRMHLDDLLERMTGAAHRHTHQRRLELERSAARLFGAGPAAAVERHRMAIAFHGKNMTTLMKHAMEKSRERLATQQATLSALNPLSVLDRGYSLTTKIPEGWIIREAALIHEGDEIDIRLRQGRIQARVGAVQKGE